MRASDNSAPWIVLVNGLFASRKSWTQALPFFLEHYNCLIYDGRGQGEGPRPCGPYLLEDLVTDLFDTLKAAEISNAFFMGVSNGARVALKFAELFPQISKGVIAASTYSKIDEVLYLKMNSWLMANKTGGSSLRFDVASPWIWSQSTISGKIKLLESYREAAAKEPPETATSLIEGAMLGIIDLIKLKCPVLFVCGENDVLTPVKMHQDMLQQYFGEPSTSKSTASEKAARLLIVPGAHARVLETADDYPLIIENFLQLTEGRKNGMVEIHI